MSGVYSYSRSSWRVSLWPRYFPFTHVQSDRRTLPFTACCLVTTGRNDSVFIPLKNLRCSWIWKHSKHAVRSKTLLIEHWMWMCSSPQKHFLGRRCMNVIVLINEISSQVTWHLFLRKSIIWFHIFYLMGWLSYSVQIFLGPLWENMN